MAQYKVLQDIEAEDKLLGPLSLRQFIYAAITVGLGFITFRLVITPAWFFGLFFVPPIIFFGLLAAPLGGQQSSEIWLLAKIRFFLKPRRRIWDQSGIQDLVTITVPKKVERQLTKGYSNDEVKSRLRTLAATLDTRGWAVKNAVASPYSVAGDGSDRLLDIAAQAVPAVYIDPSVDMLDPQSNQRAQAMDQMITKASQEHKQRVLKNMHGQSGTSSVPAVTGSTGVSKAATISQEDEQAILKTLEKSHYSNLGTSHLKTLQPTSAHAPHSQQKHPHNPVTPTPDPAILNIVENSEDLSVQTIARQANRVKDQGPDDEVVISLH